jgi:hypothetical protein
MMTMTTTTTTNNDALPLLIIAGQCGWTEVVRYIVDQVPPECLQGAHDAIANFVEPLPGSDECLTIIQAAIDWETLNAGALDVLSVSSITMVPPRRTM